MARDLPSIAAQAEAINLWLQRFGGRRPSEAAMEVVAMSAGHRRKLFRNLRAFGCIALTEKGWRPVKDIPTAEQAAAV